MISFFPRATTAGQVVKSSMISTKLAVNKFKGCGPAYLARLGGSSCVGQDALHHLS